MTSQRVLERQKTERMAEAAALAEFLGNGWKGVNANHVLRANFPLIDLLVWRGSTRLLVQVRGARKTRGKFSAPPAKCQQIADFAAQGGYIPVFAFVDLRPGRRAIRFESALEVKRLAQYDEAATPGVNMFHVNISDLDKGISRISELSGR
jgi:hypothetical protein